jgi:hypothetical protein
MAVTTPDWLATHGGEVRESKGSPSWVVYLDGEPAYLLVAVPVAGKFGCRISETVSGRRLDGPGTWDGVAPTLAGGLDELRKRLGW